MYRFTFREGKTGTDRAKIKMLIPDFKEHNLGKAYSDYQADETNERALRRLVKLFPMAVNEPDVKKNANVKSFEYMLPNDDTVRIGFWTCADIESDKEVTIVYNDQENDTERGYKIGKDCKKKLDLSPQPLTEEQSDQGYVQFEFRMDLSNNSDKIKSS